MQSVKELLHLDILRLLLARVKAMRVTVRHHGDDIRPARIIAQRDYSCRQLQQGPLEDLAGLRGGPRGLAGPLDLAVAAHIELEEPLAEMGMSHHYEVVVEVRAEPHDVGGVRAEPGWPPLVMQWSDPATDEVRPDHLKGEPGLGEPEDPGGGDRELLVVSVDVTPIASADRRRRANFRERRRVFLFDPAPPSPPFFPPLLHGALRIRPLGS